jgi:hypothetical protein
MDSNGPWVKIYARLADSPIWTQFSPAVLKVSIAFLLKANYKPTKWWDGEKEITLPRGSFVCSYATMAKFCSLSLQQVRDSFTHLQNVDFATYSRTHRHTVVTVCKYDTYQPLKDSENTNKNTVGTQSEHSRNTVGTPAKEYRSLEARKPEGLLAGQPLAQNGHRAEANAWLQKAMADYLGGEWGQPPQSAVLKVLQALPDDSEETLERLRSHWLHLAQRGRRPTKGWGWFVTVTRDEFGGIHA